MLMELLFLILWMSLILTAKFMSLKSRVLAKYLLAFVIFSGWWSAGFKYLGWFNSFGNFL